MKAVNNTTTNPNIRFLFFMRKYKMKAATNKAPKAKLQKNT
jgi:hypothetical protein